jgi:glycosyltransferase involved in cell wall biosynthesis
MKIGFDISQTGSKKTGCGFYADTLVRHLIQQYPQEEFYLYSTFGNTYWDPDYHKRIQTIECPNCHYPIKFKSREASYSFWEQRDLDEEKIGCPDVIQSNNFSSLHLHNARLVYTVYDLSFIDIPECTTEENRYLCFDGVFRASLVADMVVAISDYSKSRFLGNFPHFPEDRTVVAHLGNRLSFEGPERPISFLKGKEFFLAVGTLEPRKNLKRLLSAYRIYVSRSNNPKFLALAGANGWLEEDLQDVIAQLGLQNRVFVLGYVSDATLRWLYRHCWAFVYPSLYEGFGLPVLEAMASGCATITSRSSSLPEVGGDAVFYVDPLSEEDMASSLIAVEATDCRLSLQERGKARAKLFSWQTTADRVYEVYQEALKRPPNKALLPTGMNQ